MFEGLKEQVVSVLAPLYPGKEIKIEEGGGKDGRKLELVVRVASPRRFFRFLGPRMRTSVCLAPWIESGGCWVVDLCVADSGVKAGVEEAIRRVVKVREVRYAV